MVLRKGNIIGLTVSQTDFERGLITIRSEDMKDGDPLTVKMTSCEHSDSRMAQRYAHLLPDDLKEAFNAIDNTGTASILSQIYHSEEKKLKGSLS